MDFDEARNNMLKQQIHTWDVLDSRILHLFTVIPREDFVPPRYKELAFADMAIPLWNDQTMMTPMEEARIIQELNVKENDKVLILGTDSGYLTTLLAFLGQQIYYVDSDAQSLKVVKKQVTIQRLKNVLLQSGDLHHGWQTHKPFDVIVLTGSLPFKPTELQESLTLGGRLFVVLGKLPVMEATLLLRKSENTWRENKLFETQRPRMSNVKEPDRFVF
jgi:protein-L-isoaspartate(D-aspartate) O-methyltransferase